MTLRTKVVIVMIRDKIKLYLLDLVNNILSYLVFFQNRPRVVAMGTGLGLSEQGCSYGHCARAQIEVAIKLFM